MSYLIKNPKTNQEFETTEKIYNSVYQAKGFVIVREIEERQQIQGKNVFKEVQRTQITTATRTVPVKAETSVSSESSSAEQIAKQLGLDQQKDEVKNPANRSEMESGKPKTSAGKRVESKRRGTTKRN